MTDIHIQRFAKGKSDMTTVKGAVDCCMILDRFPSESSDQFVDIADPLRRAQWVTRAVSIIFAERLVIVVVLPLV